MTEFTTFHTYFSDGLTFEEAKAAAGFAECSPAVAVLLANFWELLEMERAFDSAAQYFDRLFAEDL